MTSQEMTNSRKPLTVFLVVVIVLSLTVEAYIISGGPGWLYFILMWIPALSAVIAGMISLSETKEKLSARGLFSCLHIRKSKVRYILMGILIPLVYLLIPYMIYWSSAGTHFKGLSADDDHWYFPQCAFCHGRGNRMAGIPASGFLQKNEPYESADRYWIVLGVLASSAACFRRLYGRRPDMV